MNLLCHGDCWSVEVDPLQTDHLYLLVRSSSNGTHLSLSLLSFRARRGKIDLACHTTAAAQHNFELIGRFEKGIWEK
jgi:hypothetical protein